MTTLWFIKVRERSDTKTQRIYFLSENNMRWAAEDGWYAGARVVGTGSCLVKVG